MCTTSWIGHCCDCFWPPKPIKEQFWCEQTLCNNSESVCDFVYSARLRCYLVLHLAVGSLIRVEIERLGREFFATDQDTPPGLFTNAEDSPLAAAYGHWGALGGAGGRWGALGGFGMLRAALRPRPFDPRNSQEDLKYVVK